MPDYMKVQIVPVVRTGAGPGDYSNFHKNEKGLLTERVTEETATHFIHHVCFIEAKK